jgi:large subunit ribosomal protein L9
VKVIFIEDVPDVALAGEAKEVADGYGRNYLLPKKLAVLANSQASGIVEAQLKKVALKRAQAEKEMAGVAAKLNGMEITLKAKVGEKERLYGSVTGADIAEQLSSSAGLDIDKRKIELDEPIREVGSHEVTVRFTQDITAVVTVTVEPDKVVEAKEEEEEKAEGKKAKKKSRKKAEAETVEAEVKVEEVEGEVEVKAEEIEAKTEEPEVKAEKAEPKAEKPKAKKKSQKKAETKAEKAKAEEAEAKAEETEVKAEQAEEKEAEPGE